MGAAIQFSEAASSYLGEEEKPKKKRKRRTGTKRGKKAESTKLRRISTEYSEALDKLSDVDIDLVQTNLDLLRVMRKTLIATLNTARGAFKASPRPGNVYAMTRVISDIQRLTEAIEKAIDFEELSGVIFNDVLKPFLDRTLLDLGSHIKDALEKHAGDDEKRFKRLEKPMTEAYRKYGTSLEGKIPGMQARLKRTILKYVK